jgi:NAD(P)H-dependent FMN reductase
MYIPVILGTARKGRQSEKVANFVFKQLTSNSIEAEIIDVRDFCLTTTDGSGDSELAKKFASKITKSSAIIIVSPEYNHGYPGELKIVLDLLYKEYFGKPVAFCGVSSGNFGGVRAVEQLRLVSIEFHMIPIRDAVYFSDVEKLFDKDGTIKDSSYISKTSLLIKSLQSLIRL